MRISADDLTEEFSAESFIVEEDATVLVTRDGWVKRQRSINLDTTRMREGDIVALPLKTQSGTVALGTVTGPYSYREVGGEMRGELRRADGVAWVANEEESRAKLKVQFFWPFRGDYWIIELDPEYRYAVVAHPSRDYLWILSRTPKIDLAAYETLLARIEAHGFDLERLDETPQPPAP